MRREYHCDTKHECREKRPAVETVSERRSRWRTTRFRFEVWCDWNPEETDIEEIAQNISAGEAICTKGVVIAVVNRPQDIEDEAAMSFFGGQEGDADESQG